MFLYYFKFQIIPSFFLLWITLCKVNFWYLLNLLPDSLTHIVVPVKPFASLSPLQLGRLTLQVKSHAIAFMASIIETQFSVGYGVRKFVNRCTDAQRFQIISMGHKYFSTELLVRVSNIIFKFITILRMQM